MNAYDELVLKIKNGETIDWNIVGPQFAAGLIHVMDYLALAKPEVGGRKMRGNWKKLKNSTGFVQMFLLDFMSEASSNSFSHKSPKILADIAIVNHEKILSASVTIAKRGGIPDLPGEVRKFLVSLEVSKASAGGDKWNTGR